MRVLVLTLSIAFLTSACSSFGTAGSGLPATPTGGDVLAGAQAKMAGYLYVVSGTGTIDVFSNGGKTHVRTVSLTGAYITQLVTDAAGYVYALDGMTTLGFVAVYAPGAAKLVRKINVSEGVGIGFDKKRNLYIGSNACTYSGKCGVSVYTRLGAKLVRTIDLKGVSPTALIVDKHGYVYVGSNSYSVLVYAPNSDKLARRIDKVSPTSLALDSRDYLYVGSNPYGGVTVYAPGATKPIRKIVAQGSPDAIAIDHADRLYYATYFTAANGGFVDVYAAGSSKAERVITKGINDPWSLAFDRDDNVYVSDHNVDDVTVYKPNSGSVLRKIHGVFHPFGIAYGR